MPLNANIGTVCPGAAEAARIVLSRLAELDGKQRASGPLRIDFEDEAIRGFSLEMKDGTARITAQEPREFIAGAGRLLAVLRSSGGSRDWPQGQWREDPPLSLRCHYMPAHFGNSFEVAWPGEMQRYLEDLALWGSSGYADWFDPNDMPDPFHPHVYCSGSMSLWHRKKEFMRRARKLGLEIGLGVTHNVGFLDQMRPEWTGVRSLKQRVQGQVLCPSIPEARAVCLRNHENLFADLAETGVHVDNFTYAPYDDGGCACAKCQPYFPTFLKMAAEIHEIARRYFPGAKGNLCGWWMNTEELRQVADFVKGPARDWFGLFQISVAYEAFGNPDTELGAILKDLPLGIFYHVAYSCDKRDAYLTTGAHSAPRRIHADLHGVTERGLRGFVTYNESFGDHYNQFLCTRLARVPDSDMGELTRDYCRQMYHLDGEDLDAMAAVLMDIESLAPEKAAGWAADLARLRPRVVVPERQPWAFEHVALKAELMALDHRIGTGEGWKTPADVEPFLPLIEQRLDLSERLWRGVYGLGVLRHIFTPLFMLPAWHSRYAGLCHPAEMEKRLKPDFVRVSENA